MSRLALVTGATGFVGTHLARRLDSEGWRIRAIVRPTSDTATLDELDAELAIGDVTDLEVLRGAVAGTDVVFHLAGTTFARTEAEYRRVNVEGARQLVRAITVSEPQPGRVVYLSSYAACGPARRDRPRSVEEPPEPLTAYGRTKLEAEEAVRSLEEQGIEVTILRAPAVYGPGDRALLTYFRLIGWGLAPLPAGADRRLHMIYAPDLAAALARAVEVEPGTYAVAEPVEHEWSDVIGSISRLMGRRAVRLPLPTFLVRTAAAASETVAALAGRAVPFNREKAQEMLAEAWTCELTGSEALLPPGEATPLEEGLASTIEWYRSRRWL